MKKRRAYNTDICLEYWLWYPKPDGTWEILVDKGHERHMGLWLKVGANKMFRAWGIDPMKIGEKQKMVIFYSKAIPNGTIDTRERSGREIVSIYVGEQMPPGWTVPMIRERLMCGKNIRNVETVGGKRSLDFMAYDRLVQQLHELRAEQKTSV